MALDLILDVLKVTSIVLWALLFYVLFFREYVLARKPFECKRSCANYCCRLAVSLTPEDIQRISAAGYKIEEFVEGKNKLKRINKICQFLKLDKGVYNCAIHDIKPKICREWPNKKGIFGLKKVDHRCIAYRGKLF